MSQRLDSRKHSEYEFNTAVALVLFNRPDCTAKVFQKIRLSRPKQLFIIADGPREGNATDVANCKAAREVTENIDWPCDVHRNYADVNMGCGNRPAVGISWVLDQVEEAIILEDDCLPEQSFFPYCQELLQYYRNDMRIMMISGDNFQFRRRRTSNSYYFSRFAHCTGWATWRRAWRFFDHEMRHLDEILQGRHLETIFPKKKERQYWEARFLQGKANKSDIWDYQWAYSIYIQNGLVAIPEVNLIRNIGYSAHGTHTKKDKDLFANLPTEPIQFPLKHPEFMLPNLSADRFTRDISFIHSKPHAVCYLIKKWLLEREKRAMCDAG